MSRECRQCFPRQPIQWKPLVSDPGMHHGTYVTYMPWCISGSLTRGGRENVPGACATRNFTYLVRGPWWCWYWPSCVYHDMFMWDAGIWNTLSKPWCQITTWAMDPNLAVPIAHGPSYQKMRIRHCDATDYVLEEITDSRKHCCPWWPPE